MKYLIAPSILSADFTCLAEQLRECEAAGADWIHVDVMDGRFVPNITMGPFIVEACRRVTNLPLDVHLMIEKPEDHIAAFAKAGATSVTVHVETCPHLHQTLEQIKTLGCAAGVTLNPGTPVSSIEPVLHLADLALVLSVNPGFSGQTFLTETIGKVVEIRNKLNAIGSTARLEVDGGINARTLPIMRNAGADAFVAGNAIFKGSQSITAEINALRNVVAQDVVASEAKE